mgnify:CR=1 FL=1|jgi:hypothetical protein
MKGKKIKYYKALKAHHQKVYGILMIKHIPFINLH